MQHLITIVLLMAVTAVVSGVLIPMLTARTDTPEAKAERDARLRDELAAWG